MPSLRKGSTGSPGTSVGQTLLTRLKEHPLARVGPGLITGVADDDPSGIATYSQAGAQFGLDMLWTMPLAFPLMAAIQSMCARIGRVTGKGLAANIKAAYPPIVLKAVVLLLLIANTLNIAADVAAMGEVGELVTGLDRHLMTLFFVVGTLLLQVFVPYHRYVFFLKWLTLSLLAYAAVLFTVHVPWGQVALRTFWPHFTRIPRWLRWWWASSARLSVHTFSSGRRRRKSKKCMEGRRSSQMRKRQPENFAEFDGTLGAECFIPTSLLILSYLPVRLRFTRRALQTSRQRHRRQAHCDLLQGTSPICFLLWAFSALA